MSLYVGGRRAISNVGTHSFVKQNLAKEWIRASINTYDLTENDLNDIYMIKPYAFSGNVGSSELTFPNCTFVDSNAFLNSSITKVSLPNCEYINNSSFQSFYSLTEINIPKISYVPPYAFSYCENLQTISLPLVTQLSNYSFNGCYSLKTVSCPKLNVLDSYSFSGCNNLEFVDTSSCVYFRRYCFSGCTKLDSIDFSNAYQIERQCLYNCNSLRKIWLPSTCYRVMCEGNISPFQNVNSNCIIYTDVQDENSIPSTWDQCWNYYSNNKKLNVIYGATYQDFINETLPTYPYTLIINVPNDCTVKIKYMGIEKTTNTITMAEGTTATYTIEKENCIPIDGSVTMETTDITITITSDQFVAIPSSLNINYDNATTEYNTKLLKSLVDNYNFELNASDHSIVNGPKTCLVNADIESHGYLVVRPTFNSILRVTARIGSENNWDYGGVYVDTKLYEPTWNEVKNGNNYGTGQYLMRICGSNQNPIEYTMNLEKDVLYYLNFFYVKDAYLTQPDKVYFDEIVVEKEAEIDIFEQVISNSQITTIDNSDITSVPAYAFCGCSYIQSINLPNLTTCGNNAFSQCSSLSNVNLVNLTEAPYYCLSDNHTLQSLDLPNVTRIRQSAFQYCENLRKIWLSNKCLIIDETQVWASPFYNDTNLTLYTDLTSAPAGWGSNWNIIDKNSNTLNVVWGATHEDFENA